MIELSYEKIVEAGRKAYEEKRLSAQGPTPDCSYRDRSGNPCVIGAVFTDDEADECASNNGNPDRTITDLVFDGVVAFPIYGDLGKARQLQYLHDKWVTSIAQGNAKPAERDFRKKLYGENNDLSTTSEDQVPASETLQDTVEALVA